MTGLYRRLLAEFLGTYVMIFAGTGAIVVNQVSAGSITHLGVALTWGLVVMAMVYTFGDVSGAHLNPAVSLGFAIAGRFPLREFAPYVISQILGALAASSTLLVLFPTGGLLGATEPSGSDLQSLILEFLLTAILMLVILHVSQGAKEKGITAGIVVGGVIGLEALFAGPISGASMNPARSLAPGLVSGNLEHLWIYLLAPVCGSLAAVGLFRLLKPQ